MLYDNNLTTIPEELFELENLEYLDLGRNNLKFIPDKFYKLKKA